MCIRDRRLFHTRSSRKTAGCCLFFGKFFAILYYYCQGGIHLEYCDTLHPSGYRLHFSDALVKPGTDSFLLADFTALKRGLRVCDLGAGIGLIGLLLLNRCPDLSVHGVELQSEAADMLQRNIDANALSDRFFLHRADLRALKGVLPAGETDLVVCNPPYFKSGSGGKASGAVRQAAREENTCTIAEVCAAAAYLLRWGGTFSLVFRPERLADLLCAMRAAGIEPKRLRFVEKQAGSAPILILAEGRRGGNPGLRYEPPLVIYDGSGRESAEMDRINFRNERKATQRP